jgi:hypothetical protein
MPNPFEEHSSREEVRSSVHDGWHVLWGKHIDDMEYGKLLASLATGTAAAYFQGLLTEIVAKFGQQIAQDAIENWGQSVFVADLLELQVGIATYRYWHEVWNVVEFRTEKVALRPNTHQLYVRWKSDEAFNENSAGNDEPTLLDSAYLEGYIGIEPMISIMMNS